MAARVCSRRSHSPLKKTYSFRSHKLHAFYLVQLVILISHADPVAVQMSALSEMRGGERETESKARIPVLRASRLCEGFAWNCVTVMGKLILIFILLKTGEVWIQHPYPTQL